MTNNLISDIFEFFLVLLFQVQNRSDNRTEQLEPPLNNIMISTDTDQYQGIYCNISAHIAQPWCDLFDRIHRLVRSEALQHRGIGTQLAVSTSDKLNVKCSLYCCRSYHPAPASTSDWEGSVIECFPGLHHTACCTYRKDRQLRTASWMPMIAPHGLPLVSLHQLRFFFS